MKKIIVALLALLMIAGCSSNKHTGEVIWKNSKTTYTTSDLYDEIIDSTDVSNVVMSSILSTIAKNDGYDFETAKNEIEETYDYYITLLGEDATMSYMGTKEYFVQVSMLGSIIDYYVEKDVNDNLQSYIDKCRPYQAEIIYLESEDAAKAVKDAVSAGTSTFAYAASENGYTSEITKKVYTDGSDLPVEVKELVLSVEDTGLYTTKTSTFATNEGVTYETDRYYLVNIISRNVNDFMDEFVSEVKTNVVNEDSIINNLLVSNNVSLHDQKIYDYVSTKYSGVK